MKIVDVSGFYSDSGGGVRGYVRQKLAAAAALGHAVTVVAPGARDRVETLEGGKIVWVASPPMPFDANYRMFWRAAAVWRVLDAEAPDVVEGSSPWRGGWIAATWPGNAVRALVFHQDFVAGYAHTLLDRYLTRPAIDGLFSGYWRYVRRLSEHFDVTIAGGGWLAERLGGFGLRHPIAVPFGVERRRFSPRWRDETLRRDLLTRCGVGAEGRLLLGVGRFHPEKRWSVVIDAFARARAREPGLALVLVGDGLGRRAVERAAHRAGHVHLAGAIADRDRLARLYASADALVHGSGAETYGLVVAEAIASGLPVITPDSGGAADLAALGFGHLYTTGDAGSCAAAILAWARAASPAAREGGVESVRTSDAHFRALFALYRGLIVGRGDRGRSPPVASTPPIAT